MQHWTQKCFLNILVSMPSFSLILQDVKSNKVLPPPTISHILLAKEKNNLNKEWLSCTICPSFLVYYSEQRSEEYPSSTFQSLYLYLLCYTYVSLFIYSILTLYITFGLQNFVKIQKIALKKGWFVNLQKIEKFKKVFLL